MSTYETAKASVQKLIDETERLKPEMEFADNLAAQFPKFEPSVIPNIECGGIIISLRGLDDFESAVPLCAAIVRAGYHPLGHYDQPEDRHRVYRFGRDRNHYRGEFSVFAQLVLEGAACEFKQIGVKEQPVYELVCK